ncbi:MAG TPA: type II toxin-antitoxin system PemK/MazF family toxin [Tepidisphaeraceae bacterium]|nr:type II toxin-antitoxin system PemK/MazF family toxin [Tepidisphaeraceae bacterium]
MKLHRGEIWLVDLEPTRRGELGKTRPCLIVSDDGYNQMAPAPLVMPITTYAATVRSPAVPATPQTGLSRESSVLPLHVRAVARSRFVQRLGRVPGAVVEQAVDILVLVVQK